MATKFSPVLGKPPIHLQVQQSAGDLRNSCGLHIEKDWNKLFKRHGGLWEWGALRDPGDIWGSKNERDDKGPY